MRRIRFLALLLAVALSGSLALSEAGETMVYDALLPNSEWNESDPEVAFHATQVVDAETGKPIAGATLEGFEEASPRSTLHSKVVCEAVSNADGIAWVKTPGPMVAHHWLVQAKGYAPAYNAGYQPETVFRLVRGVEIEGWLVDVLGVPLANLELELFFGGPYGPVYKTVRTDEGGFVRLPRVDVESSVQVWAAPPRGHAHAFDPWRLAEATAHGRRYAFEPSRTVRGQVVNAAGDPLSDAVVRRYGSQPPKTRDAWTKYKRGPTARTDRDGRFVMAGVVGRQASEGLVVFAADGQRVFRKIPDTPNPSLRIVIDDVRPVREKAPKGLLILRAVDEEGGLLPRFPQILAVRDDGIVEGLGATPGYENDLLPGVWDVVPTETFAGASFKPFRVHIVSGETTRRDVAVWQQPRTALAGVDRPIKSLGDYAIATATEQVYENVLRLMEGLVHIPRGQPVVLYSDNLRHRFASERVGRRVVRIRATEPAVSVVELRTPTRLEAVWLERDGVEVDELDGEGPVFRTHCVGNVMLVADDGGRTWRVPVGLTGGRRVVVDLTALAVQPRRRGPVKLTWRLPDGSVPESLQVVTVDAKGEEIESIHGATSPEELRAPCHMRLSGAGLQPIEVDLTPGTQEVVWGPKTLVLETFTPGGKRVHAVVLVDGALHRVYDDQPFRLRGLPAGRHRVVVTPLDVRLRGVQLTLDLAEAVTTRRVEFTVR